METNTALLNSSSPIAWLAASLGIAVIATHLAYVVHRRAPFLQTPWAQIIGWAGTRLFFIVVPLAAWRRGALSPLYLGLSGLDWIPSLALGVPLATAITAIILFGWFAYRRTLPVRAEPLPRAHLVVRLRAPMDAILLQWHWAFYRALAIAWVAALPALTLNVAGGPGLDLAADPIYWGSWLGLAFTGLEAGLNPFMRAAARGPYGREVLLRQVFLGLTTTGLFIVTRNLWLCLACHVAVETAVAAWAPSGREPSHQQKETRP